MANDNSDYPQLFEGALRSCILLTLPWLSLQRQMLEIAIKGLENASHIRPFQNFTLSELQALAMILDRSRTVRDLVDPDFEKRLENTLKEMFPKFASASVQSLQAQEAILACVTDALNELRKDNKKDGRPGGKRST